jgi:molybdopterin synthase sulfur carrier subunit
MHPGVDTKDGHVTGVITVRYFAGARAAAGVDEEELTVTVPQPLPSLADHLAARHGEPLARVLRAASFLVNETAGSPDRVVEAGATVDVLPPFAGG